VGPREEAVSGRLKINLVDRADFERYRDTGLGQSGMFVPSTDPSIGDRVVVEVIFQNGPRILLLGVVKWRRATGDQRTRAGVGVEFSPSESAKVSYLNGYVRGGLLDVREKRRLPIRLKVAYAAPRGRRLNFTRDLNEESAFVRTAEQLPLGTAVPLMVYPPGGDFRPLEVNGEVARQSDGSDRGVGVVFRFADDAAREVWHKFIARLEGEYFAGKLDDDALL
jgi:Tfp pilus assembly protein PilZ